MKKLAIAIGSLCTAAAPLAFAQYYGPDRDYRDNREYRRDSARVIESRPVYASGTSRQECWNPRANHYEEVRAQEETHVGKGAAIGAIAGGVLGHQVGSGNGNTAATVGGALLGGLAGHQVEKRNDRDDQPDLDRSRCRYVSDNNSGAVAGYDVRYEYRGQEYVARMDRDPGNRLVLGRDINSDGTPY
jgi:uncharacterized protein YcfJ